MNIGYGALEIASGVAEVKNLTLPIPAATTSAAGVMAAADKTKLNGVATGATADSAITTEEIEGLFD